MAKCKCHGNYDDDNDWWKCPVHDRVTKAEYEEEYDVNKPVEKKSRPTDKGTGTTKKPRPAPAKDDNDEEGNGDDEKSPTNEPPDRDDKTGTKAEDKSADDGKKTGPSHGMSRGFWGD